MRYLLLLVLLLGCGPSKKPSLDLNNYDRAGSAGPMRLYMEPGLTHEQYQWFSNTANLVGSAYQQGYAAVHFGPETYSMTFPPPTGRIDLVPIGTLLSRPARYVNYNDMVPTIVIDGPVNGYTPTGPGAGCKAGLVWVKDGRQAIMVTLGTKGECAGLYTALNYRYERENAPDDQIDWYRYWAQVYAIDDTISDAIRNSR